MKASELFIRALEQLEQTHTPDPLVQLFNEESELTRLDTHDICSGQDGARAFWEDYLSLFKEIRSQFTNVIEAGNTSVLEWEAQGHFESGEPISYSGVSIVEFDGDKVRRFRTYYDSARFAQPAHA